MSDTKQAVKYYLIFTEESKSIVKSNDFQTWSETVYTYPPSIIKESHSEDELESIKEALRIRGYPIERLFIHKFDPSPPEKSNDE